MALHWRPVGPEPEQTYWLRRAAVALAVLLPLWLLTSLLTGGGEPDSLAQAPATPAPSAAPSAVPSDLSTAVPTVSPTPTVTACAPAALRIEAAATEESYAVGASPKLELTVTNTGTTPCTATLGQGAVELVVTSGSDRIWSSDDCAPAGATEATTLEPGKADVSRVTWSGKRSRPGCTGDQERAEAGTYRVTGRVGEQSQQGASFLLR